MALGNWDTLSIDETGKVTDGVFISPLGVEVSVYKNWLNVDDRAAPLRKKTAEGWPTVMRIDEGRLEYQDVRIIATRGPQDGIYAIVWISTYTPGGMRGMLAIGCEGHDAWNHWSGVRPESVHHWGRELLRHQYDNWTFPDLEPPDELISMAHTGHLHMEIKRRHMEGAK